MAAVQNLNKEFQDIKGKLQSYDKELNYEKKMNIANELMQIKFVNKEKHMERMRAEQARSLFKHPPDLQSQSSEETTFQLTPQQKFLKRFLSKNTGNTGILLFHGTGMGKTCSSLNIAENFLNAMRQKVLVICSEIIQQRFKDEIKANGKDTGCLGGFILDRITPGWRLLKEQDIDKLLDKFIDDHFEFTTLKRLFRSYERDVQFSVYETIAEELKKLKGLKGNVDREKERGLVRKQQEIQAKLGKYVKENFSDRVIIYDEVHGIRSNKNEKFLGDNDDDNDDDNEKEKQISFLKQVMTFAKNVRLVLMSATPMYHVADEIVTIMELLMLNDKSVPSNMIDTLKDLQSSKLSKTTTKGSDVEKLLKYFGANFVSFGKVDKSDKDFPVVLSPFRRGTPSKSALSEHKLTKDDTPDTFQTSDNTLINDEYGQFIYKSYLSERQKKALEVLSNNEKRPDEVFLARLMNACYVDPYTQKPGAGDMKNDFNILFGEKKTGNTLFEYKGKQTTFKGDFLNKVSPKIGSIMDVVEKSMKSKQDGYIMIYSRFHPSGAWPVCVALEEAGFDRYGKDVNFITPKRGSSTNKYILLSHRRNEMKRLFKSTNEELISTVNALGQQEKHNIRVIVCTDVVREGVDFRNIRQIHVLEPWYNESKLIQIIGRGVRMSSHSSLEESQRNVMVFKHCCIHGPAKKKGTTEKKKESFDYYRYKKSQVNFEQIKNVEKILKSHSIDCNLTKPREANGRELKVRVKSMLSEEEFEHVVRTEDRECAHKELKANESDLVVVNNDIQTVEHKVRQYFKKKNILLISREQLKKDLDYRDKLSTLFDLAMSKILKRADKFTLNGRVGQFQESRGHILFVDSKTDLPIISSMQLKLYRHQRSKTQRDGNDGRGENRKVGKVGKVAKVAKNGKLSKETAKKAVVEERKWTGDISQVILNRVEKLKERLSRFVSLSGKEEENTVVYSMVLHRLNREESDAFVRTMLDANDKSDKNNAVAKKTIIEKASGDMILETESGRRVVLDIPDDLKFKFKSNDGTIQVESGNLRQLRKVLLSKSKSNGRFPKYFRKYVEKSNTSALYVLENSAGKAANVLSNDRGKIKNMMEQSKNLEGKAKNTIFKPSFSPDKVNVGGTNEWGLKDLVADVLEYTSRHYGLYVHPVVQSIDDEERKNAKKNAKKKANGSQK